MTGNMRNRIENLWDMFWSSGVTNPLTIVEQITYLLFIKILDDNELRREANAAAFDMEVIDPIFDANHQNCRWHIFRHYDPDAMFDNMINHVFPFIKGNLGEAKDASYSKYLKDALFLVPSARVLTRVVDALDSLDINNKDIMGDVYEVLLSQMAQSGRNGQFRTPRHIINMMVELMRPTLDDEICDPAMGTAGFLCAATQYISNNYQDELLNSQKKHYFNTSMFTGFDTDQTMLRIGAMNMMLHGVEEPNIKWQDSLSEENKDRGKYSLILANPPFAGSIDKDSISKDLLTITNTSKTELLFLSLFVQMLKTGGRCASIVPNGVLSTNSAAHIAIRKELIDNQKLEAVISIPPGTFQPYSIVSTAILIFTKTNHGGTDKVWFYDIRSDGYSLDPRREPIEENDIPDLINRFNNLCNEHVRSRDQQSFFVDVEEIRDNDYSLAFGRYSAKVIEHEGTGPFDEIIKENINELKERIDRAHLLEESMLDLIHTLKINGSVQYKKLNEVATVIDSLHTTPKYSEDGIPMVRVTDVRPGNLSLDNCVRVSRDVFEQYTKKHIPQKDEIIISRVGTYGVFSYINEQEDFCLGQNTAIIVPKINSRYLYHCLISREVRNQIEQKVVGANQKTLSLKSINDLDIPVFDKDTMDKISRLLETIDDFISTTEKMTRNLDSISEQVLRQSCKGEINMEELIG